MTDTVKLEFTKEQARVLKTIVDLYMAELRLGEQYLIDMATKLGYQTEIRSDGVREIIFRERVTV